MFFVDADVIITGSLAPIVAAAENGKVCAGIDGQADRWFPEWEAIFGVSTVPRRQPYCNSGGVMFSTHHHPELLRRWWECCDRIAESCPEGKDFARPGFEHPIALTDQDALNAVLMTDVREDDLEIIPPAMFANGPEMDAVVVRNAERLVCTVGAEPTVLLHAFGTPKPWQRTAARHLAPTAYVKCLRVLINRALDPAAPAPHVDPRTLPRWLHPTATGRATLAALVMWWRVVRRRDLLKVRFGREEAA